ncbi:MAG: alpha/beta fold hydrolase, partial [Alphaproteobacteria bacterium]
ISLRKFAPQTVRRLQRSTSHFMPSVVKLINSLQTLTDSHSLGSSVSASVSDPSTSAAPEPCPTPLNWVEVVASVSEDTQRMAVPLDGGELVADVYGSGPALYFLGGATGSSRLFALTAYLLREELTSVMLQPVEWTRSPRQPLEQVSEATVRLANSLGHSSINVYAAGTGCHQALSLTQRHSARVGSLMLQGPALRQPTLLRERVLHRIGQWLTRPVSTLPGWQKVQEQNHHRYFPPFDTTRFQFLLDDTGATPIRQAAYRWRAASETDWSALAPTIRCPVMVIRCEGEGAALAKLCEEFTAHVPGCRSEWLHTTGHYPYLTHPHRLVKLIKQFLNPPVA